MQESVVIETGHIDARFKHEVLFSHFLNNQRKLDRQNFKAVLIDVIF